MRFSPNFFRFAQKQRSALDKATFFWYNEVYAPVVKLADTMDLGSISARNAGSSPVRRTTSPTPEWLNKAVWDFSFYAKLELYIVCTLFELRVQTVFQRADKSESVIDH